MFIGENIKLNLPNNRGKMQCKYFEHWYGVPIYRVDGSSNVYCMRLKDGSCIIVMGSEFLRVADDVMVCVALWHEVSHLYYNDCLKKWRMEYEYRADTVSSMANTANAVINCLEKTKRIVDPRLLNDIENRQKKIYTGGVQINVDPVDMIGKLKGAKVVRQKELKGEG